MTVKLRSPSGIVVEASEKAAKRLVEQQGWHYIVEPPKGVQTLSEPITPKRRGPTPRKKVTND